jgi:hypothetical protein
VARGLALEAAEGVPAAASEGLNVGGEGAAVGCGVGALVGQRGPGESIRRSSRAAAAANDGPMLAGVPAYEGLAVVIDETQMRFRWELSPLRLTAVPARQPPAPTSTNQLSRVAPSAAPVL